MNQRLKVFLFVLLVFCGDIHAASLYSWNQQISKEWKNLKKNIMFYSQKETRPFTLDYQHHALLLSQVEAFELLLISKSNDIAYKQRSPLWEFRESILPYVKSLKYAIRGQNSDTQLKFYMLVIDADYERYMESCITEQARINRFLFIILGVFFVLVIPIINLVILYRTKNARSQIQEIQTAHFAQEIITVQEAERLSLARELHDTVAQDLLCIKMSTESLKRVISKNDTQFTAYFSDIIKQETDCLNQIRTICTELRPPELEHLGIKPSLAALCSQFQERTGIHCMYLVSGITHLDKDLEIHCFRIVQEALNNIRKHAEANEVLVQLTGLGNKSFSLLVEDNGIGFDLDHIDNSSGSSFGLKGIQERVRSMYGNYNFSTQKGIGTSLFITIPLTAPIKDL